MNKLHKLSKLRLILLIQLMVSLCSAAPSIAIPVSVYYGEVVVSNGLDSVPNPCFFSQLTGQIAIRAGDRCFTSSTQSISVLEFSATKLYYQSAPGYQNAQCTADGVPKASGEEFNLSPDSSHPTQIICTAEKIPDEPEPLPETTLNITNPETIQFFNLPTSVDLSINPSADGVFQSAPLNITLGSNYPNGYTLYMNVDTTNLVNPNSTTPLSTLDSVCSADDFTVNRWGYSTDGTLFQPILTSQQLDTVNGPINNRVLALALGAKINLAQPNGSYTGHITFMAIPNLVTE